MHYAAIDIGSNAVRLLVKKLEDEEVGRFSRTVMMRVPLRLGQDVFTTGEFSKKKASDLVELMKAYSIIMKLYDIDKANFRACATAAFREASNGEKVVRKVLDESKVPIEIISGEEEANIFCQAICRNDKRTLVFVDVGGGSTEVSLVSCGVLYGRKSLPFGTVRVISGSVASDWRDEIVREVKILAYDFTRQTGRSLTGATIIGAGGNINKLYALAQDRDSVERSLLVSTLRKQHAQMSSMSIEQRMDRFGLKPDRADVIVPAAEIFLCIADTLRIAEIEIPNEGLADGIIASLWAQNNR